MFYGLVQVFLVCVFKEIFKGVQAPAGLGFRVLGV